MHNQTDSIPETIHGETWFTDTVWLHKLCGSQYGVQGPPGVLEWIAGRPQLNVEPPFYTYKNYYYNY